MSYLIQRKLINYNNPKTSLKPVGIVIHNTANMNDSAMMEYNYFNDANRNASAHYVIDKDNIIQMIEDFYIAWHAGPTANKLYLSIEMCTADNLDAFFEIWKKTIWLTSYLMKNIIIPTIVTTNNLRSHAAVSDEWKETNHQDPLDYFAKFGRTMDDYRAAAQLYIDTSNIIDWRKPKMDAQKLNWEQILEKVSNSPEKWDAGITTAVGLAKDDSNLGDLEIFKFLPELIEKIYYSRL